MPFKAFSRESESNKLFSLNSKRSQSALEYMMTYGWAILIIVIVAVILYSMGIFNPSSSITTTSIGFSPFTVSSTVCSPAGLSVAIIGGGLPDTATSATISKIYITSNTGTTALIKEYNLTPVVIFPGKTATIIIPTVACASANVKYSLSAKLQYSYSTPAGPVTTNTTGTIAGASSSQATVKYVPLTITSSTATPNPFQQMVIVNMNNYNSYASSNLSNIEFTYPNGTIIPSWRENGTTNTQTVVYWLKLGSFTTATVYMDFFSTSSNVLNSVNTGEAPQIPCGSTPTSSCSNYGEYDDGVNVFTNYWNFAGTSLPSGWTVPSGSNYQVDNGFIPEPSGGSTTAVYNPNIQETSSIIVEWGINLSSTSYPNDNSEFQLNRYTTSSNMHFLGVQGSDTLSNPNIGATESIASSGVQIFGIWNDETAVDWLYNEGILFSTTSATSETDYLSLGWSYTNNFPTIYYVRTRAYPPSGVMPSVNFGSVV
jgi:hypothetical protein